MFSVDRPNIHRYLWEFVCTSDHVHIYVCFRWQMRLTLIQMRVGDCFAPLHQRLQLPTTCRTMRRDIKLVDLQFVCCHFKHMKLLTSLGYSSFFYSFTKGKTSNTFCGILSAGVRQPLVNWWAISNSEQFVWQIIVTIYFCIYLFTELLNAALK